jgi:hypothetical protein
MKNKWFLGIFLFVLLLAFLFAGINSYLKTYSQPMKVDVFVGVDAAYDGVQDVKNRVDEVKSFTNFFVIGSTGITFNETRVNDVCQYVNDSGLNFVIFSHKNPDLYFSQAQWVSEARNKWSPLFMGLYAYDEPGGIQVDRYEYENVSYMLFQEANNYSDASTKYVDSLRALLNEFRVGWNVGNFPLITSEYALHEFDYRAGYDVVLTEFGWNLSRPLAVALCRGAAAMQNRDWGVMITYTYDGPPYLESGDALFNDMVTAYQNGAKYIVVFDYTKDYEKNISYGILQQEHLDALKRFWQYIQENPRPTDAIEDRVAYVLPKDYGYGLRGTNDKIWGLWEADNLSSKVWNDANSLVDQYGWKLDIIYEDALQPNGFRYSKLVFWNGTTITR